MTTIRLPDPQGQLMEEIANPKMTRKQVAMTYRWAANDPERVDWPAVNRAIVDRWSLSALKWIKDFAWSGARECARCGSTMCDGCYPAPVEYPGFELPLPEDD